jgi:ribosomal protein L11 methyltransferase
MKQKRNIPASEGIGPGRTILGILAESGEKLTPKELEKRAYRTGKIEKETFRQALKGLVEAGEIAYTYHFGCSFLEASINRPVRMSACVVVKPPEMTYAPLHGEVVINLHHGASFGSGDHPTTRLAVRGIEHALTGNSAFSGGKPTGALDIGTGSGILAITAVLLGAAWAVGIDIDPCAVAEARANIRLNKLEDRIRIEDRALEAIDQTAARVSLRKYFQRYTRRYKLISANLRLPTLKRLSPKLTELLEQDGIVVISGIKGPETPDLVHTLDQNGFPCVWEETEKDWAGLVFKKGFKGSRIL